MGFNVTALAQKARTQTLIADSDLDMGQYDIIATDVKGDTAEFSEFVGGVGNFTSGLFSGGVDVSGILHAEGNTQVDGNIILEGSINNVNIADDGEITTTKGVNGADFNGAVITSTKFNGATIDGSGNVTGAKGTFSGAVNCALLNETKTSITVTATTTVAGYAGVRYNANESAFITLLQPKASTTYSGNINFNNSSSSALKVYYYNGLSNAYNGQTVTINANSTGTLSFSNIPYLIVASETYGSTLAMKYCRFTLS